MNKIKRLFNLSGAFQLIALVCAGFMLFAGCSMMRPNLRSPELLPDVSFVSVTESCTTPSRVYNVPPGRLNPAPIRVAFFDECLGRSNVFLVLWPGEGSEINVQFSRLLGLHFKENYSFERRVVVTHEEWGPFVSDDGNLWFLVFHLKHD